jgi:hypothetical protein
MCLERKRLKAEAILACEPQKIYRDWSELTEEELQKMYQEHGSWAAVERFLGVRRLTVVNLRWRRRNPGRQKH